MGLYHPASVNSTFRCTLQNNIGRKLFCTCFCTNLRVWIVCGSGTSESWHLIEMRPCSKNKQSQFGIFNLLPIFVSWGQVEGRELRLGKNSEIHRQKKSSFIVQTKCPPSPQPPPHPPHQEAGCLTEGWSRSCPRCPSNFICPLCSNLLSLSSLKPAL